MVHYPLQTFVDLLVLKRLLWYCLLERKDDLVLSLEWLCIRLLLEWLCRRLHLCSVAGSAHLKRWEKGGLSEMTHFLRAAVRTIDDEQANGRV